MTYNAETNLLSYYINGTLYNSETRELSFPPSRYGYIAGRHAKTDLNPYTSVSAEVKQYIFFDKALTDAEAVSLTTIS